jgi:hypothetical protein
MYLQNDQFGDSMETNMKNKNIAIFKSEDGAISFDVPIDTDTVWLTQKQKSNTKYKNI